MKLTHSAMIGMILPTMLSGIGGLGLPGGSRSSASIRHDPNRPKTPEDLERREAARLKRERKATRNLKKPAP